MDVNIVPFGDANCTKIGTRHYECNCQHGALECALNTLMNCVKERYVNIFQHYIPLIVCIQGEQSIESAVNKCFKDDKVKKELTTCAYSKHGRFLLARAGQLTKPRFTKRFFVPGVIINDSNYTINDVFEFRSRVCTEMNLSLELVECKNVNLYK
ncbi:unnamed protein product [Bursaphelenchus okinawaensis]|uniref:Uncharacterized protein n=1 Tax=Bursaphelenchus okinawaensis TaxID=465554 RepID=A0A811KAM8_9BILA|nr:unnamed protein product [Bursaphelenchus okinawaensis]CAG9097673.1 unnamed protein product [Bursaphelenchus okinawaensis]